MPVVGSAGGTGLVGREAELGALQRAQATHALVTVTGLPGVGRSALVAAAGVPTALVYLASVEDPLSVVDAVLAELPGDRLSTSLPEALWEAYGGAPVRLVLEDVDRVEGLADLLGELVLAYPEVSVVCTAVRPLHADGEHVVRLAALPLPPDDAPPDHPAVVLFAQRASVSGLHPDLDDPDVRRDVARICRAAGGLPGAIVWAAARAGTLPPAAVARALAARQGTDPALAWTVDLLTKAAQRALVQVSVFEGPFELDAAGAVVDRGPASGDPADDLLELVDASLVELAPTTTGRLRFVVPTTVRAFARQLLDSGEHAGSVRDRHARYFRNRGRFGADAVRREWADVSAALDHLIRSGGFDDGLAAAVALAPDVQEIPGASASVQARIAELMARGEAVPGELHARALLWSTTLFPQGVAADMQRVGLWTAQQLAAATEAARESGDAPALLETLEQTIRSLRVTLDLASAVAAAHEGLELARRLDDQRALARFEVWSSMAVQTTGDREGAARLAASALTRGREHGDAVAVIYATQILLGVPEELRPALEQPLADLDALLLECERAEQPLAAMTVLGAMAHAALTREDAPAAARAVWRLLMVAANRQRSEPLATIGAVSLLVSVALALGERTDAVRLRESVRPFEMFVPYCMPPDAYLDFQRDVAALAASVPEDETRELAMSVAGRSMEDTNRWSQEVARRLARHQPPEPEPPTVPDLTPRETDVLAALASGRTNREIAELLGMSAKTVMHHSVSIYRKLGVRGRTGATAWAVEHGVTR
jgi:DNA-binding CsgD family transcriptional regulator/predicted ATPase